MRGRGGATARSGAIELGYDVGEVFVERLGVVPGHYAKYDARDARSVCVILWAQMGFDDCKVVLYRNRPEG